MKEGAILPRPVFSWKSCQGAGFYGERFLTPSAGLCVNSFRAPRGRRSVVRTRQETSSQRKPPQRQATARNRVHPVLCRSSTHVCGKFLQPARKYPTHLIPFSGSGIAFRILRGNDEVLLQAPNGIQNPGGNTCYVARLAAGTRRCRNIHKQQ